MMRIWRLSVYLVQYKTNSRVAHFCVIVCGYEKLRLYDSDIDNTFSLHNKAATSQILLRISHLFHKCLQFDVLSIDFVRNTIVFIWLWLWFHRTVISACREQHTWRVTTNDIHASGYMNHIIQRLSCRAKKTNSWDLSWKCWFQTVHGISHNSVCFC